MQSIKDHAVYNGAGKSRSGCGCETRSKIHRATHERYSYLPTKQGRCQPCCRVLAPGRCSHPTLSRENECITLSTINLEKDSSNLLDVSQRKSEYRFKLARSITFSISPVAWTWKLEAIKSPFPGKHSVIIALEYLDQKMVFRWPKKRHCARGNTL